MANKIVNVTLKVADWVKVDGYDIWQQNINSADIAANMQLVAALDDTNTMQVIQDHTMIRCDNVDGVGVAKAFGTKPTADVTVQLTLTPVEA